MSNNRMWLVHRATGKRILLAKYGSEWWRFHDDLNAALDAFFEDQDNKSETFRFKDGGNAYVLEYETGGAPPDEVLAAVRADYDREPR